MKCDCCGRFFKASPRAMWQMVYSGFPQAPDREIHRCETCVDRFGELQPQTGIVPEFSVGFLRLGSRLDARAFNLGPIVATALKESAPWPSGIGRRTVAAAGGPRRPRRGTGG